MRLMRRFLVEYLIQVVGVGLAFWQAGRYLPNGRIPGRLPFTRESTPPRSGFGLAASLR